VTVLYPADPLHSKQPDDQFALETEAVRATGFDISLFSFERFQNGEFHASPGIPNDTDVLYRGWMLSASEYEALTSALSQARARPLIPAREYLGNHYLPNWYPLIKDLTPETRIYPIDCDLEAELRKLDWPEYFIKDYVKSLKTSAGSRISKPELISAVVAEMRRFRGTIEGGFCVRRVEPFLPETERRYFVLNGTPYSAFGDTPPIVHECAKCLPGRFYSVDIVQRLDGRLRVVEVGDGQVSDSASWAPEQFAKVLADLKQERS
jgi:hypothetical protein